MNGIRVVLVIGVAAVLVGLQPTEESVGETDPGAAGDRPSVTTESPRTKEPRLDLDSGLGATGLANALRRLTVRGVRARISGTLAGLAVEEMGLGPLHLEGSLSATPSENGWTTALEKGRVEPMENTGLVPPATLTLRVSEVGGTVSFRGEAVLGRGDVTVEGRGRFQRAAGAGAATISIRPIRFDPKGLQPAGLSSAFQEIDDVRGALSGQAEVRWDRRSLTGRATVSIDSLSFVFEGVSVEGLSTAFSLAELWPPVTDGIQLVEIRKIQSVVALEDVSLRYGVTPANGGRRLEIERLDGELLGGSFRVENAAIDASDAINEVALSLEAIDLSRLFDVADVEGVSGTGSLSGTIPVRVQDDTVAIDGGRLEAMGPGILRVRSETVASILSGRHESVDLLVRALREFHYEDLRLIVNKRFEGETEVRLELRGNNPGVLDGHPFAINVNLAGNLERLVASITDVVRLADQAVRATMGPR